MIGTQQLHRTRLASSCSKSSTASAAARHLPAAGEAGDYAAHVRTSGWQAVRHAAVVAATDASGAVVSNADVSTRGRQRKHSPSVEVQPVGVHRSQAVAAAAADAVSSARGRGRLHKPSLSRQVSNDTSGAGVQVGSIAEAAAAAAVVAPSDVVVSHRKGRGRPRKQTMLVDAGDGAYALEAAGHAAAAAAAVVAPSDVVVSHTKGRGRPRKQTLLVDAGGAAYASEAARPAAAAAVATAGVAGVSKSKLGGSSQQSLLTAAGEVTHAAPATAVVSSTKTRGRPRKRSLASETAVHGLYSEPMENAADRVHVNAVTTTAAPKQHRRLMPAGDTIPTAAAAAALFPDIHPARVPAAAFINSNRKGRGRPRKQSVPGTQAITTAAGQDAADSAAGKSFPGRQHSGFHDSATPADMPANSSNTAHQQNSPVQHIQQPQQEQDSNQLQQPQAHQQALSDVQRPVWEGSDSAYALGPGALEPHRDSAMDGSSEGTWLSLERDKVLQQLEHSLAMTAAPDSASSTVLHSSDEPAAESINGNTDRQHWHSSQPAANGFYVTNIVPGHRVNPQLPLGMGSLTTLDSQQRQQHPHSHDAHEDAGNAATATVPDSARSVNSHGFVGPRSAGSGPLEPTPPEPPSLVHPELAEHQEIEQQRRQTMLRMREQLIKTESAAAAKLSTPEAEALEIAASILREQPQVAAWLQGDPQTLVQALLYMKEARQTLQVLRQQRQQLEAKLHADECNQQARAVEDKQGEAAQVGIAVPESAACESTSEVQAKQSLEALQLILSDLEEAATESDIDDEP